MLLDNLPVYSLHRFKGDTAMDTLGWNVTDQTFHHIFTQESQLQCQQSPSLTQPQLSAPAEGFLHSKSSPGSCTNWVDEHVTSFWPSVLMMNILHALSQSTLFWYTLEHYPRPLRTCLRPCAPMV